MTTERSASSTIEIGRIARAHGIGGAVRIALHWEHSQALRKGAKLTVVLPDGSERELEIESVGGAGKQPIVKFAGVGTRNDSEALRGARVLVDRSTMPALEPGEYYLVDLIGAEVVAPEGAVGEVVEVTTHPSVDVIVVRTPDGKLVEQPLSEQWIARVDIAAKRVELKSTDGLIA